MYCRCTLYFTALIAVASVWISPGVFPDFILLRCNTYSRIALGCVHIYTSTSTGALVRVPGNTNFNAITQLRMFVLLTMSMTLKEQCLKSVPCACLTVSSKMFVFVHAMCECPETHTLSEDKEIKQLLALSLALVLKARICVYGLSSKGIMFSHKNISCLHARAVCLYCINKFDHYF